MGINPNTLQNLYANGIIDYVPYDLCSGYGVPAIQSMQNPYLNAAKQGDLYQKYGNSADSFSFNNSTNINEINSANIGTKSNNGLLNTFGFNIGNKNNTNTANSYGFNGQIGRSNNSDTLTAFGFNNIGSQSQAGGEQIWGGFGDVRQNISNGGSKVSAAWNSTPGFVKGILSAGLIVGSFALLFKKGKKVPKQKKSFLSRLNPFNWFKKKNTQVENTNSGSKLNPLNWFRKNK